MGELNLNWVSDECRNDYKLPKSNPKACVSGQVKDCLGSPIANVCVKMLDKHYDPVVHTLTNEQGEFSLVYAVEQRGILVFAKQGYETKTLTEFSQTVVVVISLLNKNNIICGRVYNEECIPIEGARVTCFNSEISYQVFTATDGVFAFTAIPEGGYTLRIDGSNIKTKSNCICVGTGCEYLNLGVLMVEQTDPLCTIHGIVTDANGKAVVNATVVLYNGFNKQPIRHTVTNQQGLYFFGGVFRGCYYVQVFQ